VLLGLIYAPMLACRKTKDNILEIVRDRGWKYLLLGIVDVEANYLIVHAYHYTTVTSVQVSISCIQFNSMMASHETLPFSLVSRA
jgi:solute carrier family 35 protein F1/2